VNRNKKAMEENEKPMSEVAVKPMPVWRWILELVPGIAVFLFLYSIAQDVCVMESPWLQMLVRLLAGIVILGVFLLWTRIFEKCWRMDILFKFRSLGTGLTIGALFFCAVVGIMAAFGSYRAIYASPDWWKIAERFCFYFLVACGEEVVFRGILFRLIDEKFGFWWAILISASLFGFVHITNPDATLWSSVALVIEAGLLLGAAYKFSGSLWMPIGIHWTWNFIQGNVFGLEVSGSGHEESILKAVVTGPDIITGGGFGPEASIISMVAGGLLSALFILRLVK